jgi:ABC-2 type transport system ATP-binding protein
MDTLISVKDLTKSFGSENALSNVSLNIKEGEIFALLGPNGAGKTTLISCICGLVKQTEGQITIKSYNTITHYRETRKLIGLVPQELPFDSFESVYNTCEFSRGLFGLKPNRDHIKNVLKSLSLLEKKDQQIFGLSGGMKRRLLIAKALSHEPRILFLDEPTAGVDVALRKDLWKLISQLKKNGVTIILTTHYIEEAEQLADRVGIINSGKIVLVKEKASLMKEFNNKSTVINLKKKMTGLADGLAKKNISLIGNGRQLKYSSSNKKENNLQSILSVLSRKKIEFTEINTVNNSLEDIFLELVDKK